MMNKNVNIQNLTEHDLRIRTEQNVKATTPLESDHVYVPSGLLARCEPIEVLIGYLNGIPLYHTELGPRYCIDAEGNRTEGLPEPQAGVYYAVSMPVNQRAAQDGRKDIIGPNTGPKAGVIRDTGVPYAVISFQQF